MERNCFKWISVKDELPEENKNVLITVKYFNGRDSIVVTTSIGWIIYGTWHTVEEYSGFRLIRNEVTHWMELPDPAKEE